VSEKTWVYWVGLIIVAFAVVGIIGGLTGLIAPIPRFPHLRSWAPPVDLMLIRVAAMKLVGATVFLVVGVYMMIRGKS